MASPDEDNQKSANELVRTLQQLAHLYRHWTMPIRTAAADGNEDSTRAKLLALFFIVALTFAIRGDVEGSKASFAAMAAALAAALAALLHLVSKGLNVNVREPVLLSAYASTILVMLGYIFAQSFFTGTNWYDGYLADTIGHIGAATVFGVVTTYALLFAKAALIDGNKITGRAASTGLLIVLGSGAIVALIAYISDDVFNFFVNKL